MQLKDITYGEIENIIHSLSKNDWFYQVSFKGLALHFLDVFFDKNPFKMEFSEIRKKFILKSDYEYKDVPNSEAEFYYFICKEYMYIERPPHAYFMQASMEAYKDLKEIDEKIIEYNKEINCLNQDKEEGYGYKIHQFKYLIDELTAAKEEIINFLIYNIRGYSFTQARRKESPLSYGIVNIPYSYARDRKRYTPEVFSAIHNKFGWLSVREFEEVKTLSRDNYEEFEKKVREYIVTYRLIEGLENQLENSYFLSDRAYIIMQALETYNKGNTTSFCHIIPMQIEGIFYDYCLALGFSEKQLDKSSLEVKLSLIKEKGNYFMYYEYFAYTFSVIRNKIAHGRMSDDDEFDHLADLLLLDLVCVCKLTDSDELPINKFLTLLKGFEEAEHIDVKNLRVVEFFYKYGELNDLGKTGKNYIINDILEYSGKPCFWNYIKGHISSAAASAELSILVELERVIKIIKSKGINEEMCAECFKLIGMGKSLKSQSVDAYEGGDFISILAVKDYPHI
ncbi:hypothetical protein [Bacillus mycoides]|uniref:Uncharacterized protein n=1 Tax=Bacillus mycoides TaxID=1405 RepID=A0A4U3AGD2_BACMY|nr:hypothetical protein [Bacillus mycoides]TKI86361.1 hypothetical protein FC701_06230 [Bacillus mycoides]